MELEALIRALAPSDVIGQAPVVVGDLAHDTRTVGEGALFFCLPGSRRDGHDLAGDAIAAGAVALVVERPLDVDVPQLVVESSRAAMAVAADVFFGEPTRRLEVVGVTGTNGKTTTRYASTRCWRRQGAHGLIGTVDWIVGGQDATTATTPESLELQRLIDAMVKPGDEAVSLEASSHGSHYRRSPGSLRPLVFTNLTQDHLDFHGDDGGVFRG